MPKTQTEATTAKAAALRPQLEPHALALGPRREAYLPRVSIWLLGGRDVDLYLGLRRNNPKPDDQLLDRVPAADEAGLPRRHAGPAARVRRRWRPAAAALATAAVRPAAAVAGAVPARDGHGAHGVAVRGRLVESVDFPAGDGGVGLGDGGAVVGVDAMGVGAAGVGLVHQLGGDEDAAGEGVEQGIEPAARRDERARDAVVGVRQRDAGHGGHAAGGERQRQDHVDGRVQDHVARCFGQLAPVRAPRVVRVHDALELSA